RGGGPDLTAALERARMVRDHGPRCEHVLKGHTGSVESVCLSADGSRALSGSRDGTMRLWDVESEVCVRIYEGHDEAVNAVCLNNDGRLALSGGQDKSA